MRVRRCRWKRRRFGRGGSRRRRRRGCRRDRWGRGRRASRRRGRLVGARRYRGRRARHRTGCAGVGGRSLSGSRDDVARCGLLGALRSVEGGQVHEQLRVRGVRPLPARTRANGGSAVARVRVCVFVALLHDDHVAWSARFRRRSYRSAVPPRTLERDGSVRRDSGVDRIRVRRASARAGRGSRSDGRSRSTRKELHRRARLDLLTTTTEEIEALMLSALAGRWTSPRGEPPLELGPA